MTQANEMLKLADELAECGTYPMAGLPGTLKFVAGFAMTESKRDLIVSVLRAAAASGEPVAWQWRYVGQQDHEWKTRSGGHKIKNEDLPLQHLIEQRPLYPAPPAPSASVREALEAYEAAIDEAEAIFGGEYSDHYGPMFELAMKARDARRAALAQPSSPAACAFQQRVDPWLMECFGLEIARDVLERNHRFLEESIELVQANGCTVSEAHQLVDYVYGRDQGDINQEVGGVIVTLAALCLASGVDMHQAAETELARVWTKVEKIRAKHFAKPKFSPLPGYAGGDSRPESENVAAGKDIILKAIAEDCRRAAGEYAKMGATNGKVAAATMAISYLRIADNIDAARLAHPSTERQGDGR